MFKSISQIKNNTGAIFIAIIIGYGSYYLSSFFNTGFADPLIIALVFGVLVGVVLPKNKIIKPGFDKIPFLFIPIGIMFYGLKNLNFEKTTTINPPIIALLVAVMLTYYFVSIILGKMLNQKKELTYLTATGGAICGASAITVTAPAINADPDDVSISLISVFAAGIFGLFVLLPFIGVFFDLSNEVYALLAGSVVQFTGFVKVGVSVMPPLRETMNPDDVMGFALSIKAFRYLGLLIAIPLFASLSQKKFVLPWYLWAFLGAGILGTYLSTNEISVYTDSIVHHIKPIYNSIWAIAMAAIGMNTNIGKITSNSGIKAILMAFLSFFAAIIVFLIGVSFIY